MTPLGTYRLPPPSELGLPAKFAQWRPRQDEAVLRTVDASQRFVCAALPTGAGKSAYYMAVAQLTGGRTCIVTATKALQAQLMADFASMGLVEVKGRNAYPCRALTEPEAGHVPAYLSGVGVLGARRDPAAPPRTSCDDGPCHLGLDCTLRNDGCTYYDAIRAAEEADLVITNYDFWLAINAYRKVKTEYGAVIEGIGAFDTLVLDEAHDAPEKVSGFLSLRLDRADVEGLVGLRMPALEAEIPTWVAWASILRQRAELVQERIAEEIRTTAKAGGAVDRSATRALKAVKAVVRAASLLGEPGVSWVLEPILEDGKIPAAPDVTFAPLWPAPFAEKYLFRGTARVLLVSATATPKTLEYLGIAREDRLYFEQPHTFPVARRMVYHLETVKLDHRMSDLRLRAWMTQLDRILRARPGIRGLIHTGSFDRARYIREHTAHRDRLRWHVSASWRGEGRRLPEVLTDFRTRDPGEGAWLVSPSLTTGYDFADDACRCQIISKVPFPDTRSVIHKAREAEDRDYGMYLTMQVLVQTVGRSTRSETDWSETFIIDDQIAWFVWKFRHFAPKWFHEAYRKVTLIPDAPGFPTTSP